MTNLFTLEDLHAAVEKEYAPMKFVAGEEEFVFRSLLRIEKTKRNQVKEKLEEFDAQGDDLDEDDALATVQFVLTTVVDGNKATKLKRVLGDDLLVWMTLMTKWAEATQPGEASDSQD